MIVKRESYKDIEDNKWDPWEITERKPASISSINLLFDLDLRDYSRYPRLSCRTYMEDGFQIVTIPSIPVGKSSPFWWSVDGRAYNIFSELWVIVP